MTGPRQFLECIRKGDLAACLVLADWLDEHDQGGRARRLRRRYARWQKERDKTVAHANAALKTMNDQVSRWAEELRANGALVSYQLGIEHGMYLRDQDNLLAAYVERLLAEIAEVTPATVPLWVRVSQPGGVTDHVVLAWETARDVEWVAILCKQTDRVRHLREQCGNCRPIQAPAGPWNGHATRRCRRCIQLLPTVKLADLPRAPA